jgi:hypothetical protein
MQQQAFEGVQNLGPSPLVGAGAGLTGLAAQQASQAGNYQPMSAQQMYQAPQFQGMGLEYLSTQAPNLQQYQMGPAERVQGAQTGAAQTNYAPNLQTFQMGQAERARTGSFAAPGAAEAYMSPYMQNVVDVQQREAQRSADIARTQRGAQAVGAGAFGGSRQAIQEAEAARNLATQKGDIQAQGLQSAYQQAQQAYQTDAQRQLQANLANQQAGLTVGGQNLQSALGVQQLGTQTGLQTSLANQQAMQQSMLANQQMRQQANLANQQAGLTTGQQNLQALLQTQGLGAQTGMQSQQLNQAAQLQAQQQALGQNQFANQFNQQNAQLMAQYGLAGLQAGEQSRQFGANLGLQGANTLGQLGSQYGQLGQTAFGQQAAALEAQQRAGAMQQAQTQQQRDIAYEEFMRQQLYPQSQLQFLSSLLRGSIVAPQQTMFTYQQQPSAISQIGGLGLGALGLSNALGRKDGGEIKGYADGGITGGGEAMQGVTLSRVTKAKKEIMQGINPKDQLAAMLAMKDEKFVEQLQLAAAAKNQQALDAYRQQAQAPTVYDEEMSKAVSAGIGGVDAGVMEEPYAGGGIVAFQQGGTPPSPFRYNIPAIDRSNTPMARAEAILKKQKEDRANEIAANAGKPLPFPATPPVTPAAFSPTPTGLLALTDEVNAPVTQPSPAQPPTVAPQPELLGGPTPKPNLNQQIPAVRAKASASQAIVPTVDEFAEIRKSVEDQKKTLQTEDQAEAARRDAYKKAIPDDLQQRLDTYKSEAADAVKERDKDRWLAVAMGGFAAAAGQSPYALRNFAEGLGLTTKEMMSVNKDFRKLENERNKLMREEQRLDRAEKIGVEKDILAARERATTRRDSFNQFSTNVELGLAKVANDKWKTLTETKSAERRTAMIVGGKGDAVGKKDPLLARSNKLALTVADGSATPSEQAEYVELLKQIKERSEATKTKPPTSLPASEIPAVQAQLSALLAKGKKMTSLDHDMARRYAEMLGVNLPATGGSGKAVLTPGADGVLEYKPAR